MKHTLTRQPLGPTLREHRRKIASNLWRAVFASLTLDQRRLLASCAPRHGQLEKHLSALVSALASADARLHTGASSLTEALRVARTRPEPEPEPEPTDDHE